MKILVSDPITAAGMAILEDANLEVVNLPDASADEKAKACKDVHGWVIRSGTNVTEDMINSAEQLQVIGRAGVGIDNIDLAAATRKGVVVMNTPDVNTISAADFFAKNSPNGPNTRTLSPGLRLNVQDDITPGGISDDPGGGLAILILNLSTPFSSG